MVESKANETQVGGDHYKTGGEEHWDRMYRLYGSGYFVGCITKYVERHEKKNGVEDLKKAAHFIQKLIELKTTEHDTDVVVRRVDLADSADALHHLPDIMTVVTYEDDLALVHATDEELHAELAKRQNERERQAMDAYMGRYALTPEMEVALNAEKEWQPPRCSKCGARLDLPGNGHGAGCPALPGAVGVGPQGAGPAGGP